MFLLLRINLRHSLYIVIILIIFELNVLRMFIIKYASEYLIVIDDPVSSFDYGNRVGVMSLLRYQFGNILKGNVNSRILVMSHDLHSVFDLVKIRNEKKKKNGDHSFMELVNNKLEVIQLQMINGKNSSMII